MVAKSPVGGLFGTVSTNGSVLVNNTNISATIS